MRKAISKDNFASEVDRISLRHDTDYLLADGDFAKVQKADLAMIKSLEKLLASGKEPHPNTNIKAPLAAIKAKYAAEKVKGSLIDKFIGKEPMSSSGKKLAERFQQRLAQAGYGQGLKVKVRPVREWKPSDRWTCPDCGSTILYRSKSNHLKSKKHLKSLEPKSQEGGNYNPILSNIIGLRKVIANPSKK